MTSNNALPLSRVWLTYWPNIEPVIRRYGWPVSLDRVLSEHHGAVAAVPLPEVEPRTEDTTS